MLLRRDRSARRAVRVSAMIPAWLRLMRVSIVAALYSSCWLVLGGFYQYPWQIPAVVARVSVAATVAFLQYVGRGFQPRFPEWTLQFEMVRAVLRCLATHYSPYMVNNANAKHLQRQGDWAGLLLGSSIYRRPGTQIQTFEYNGLEHIWVRQATTSSTSSMQKPTRRCVLLYFHASAFCMLSPKVFIGMASDLLGHIQTKLQALSPNDAIQVDVLLANYRKAPNSPYPIPPNDTLAIYRYLLDVEQVPPHDIIIAGDSAGGGLALTTMIRVRDQNPEDLPCAAILSCPYVDLGARGDDRQVPYCFITNRALETIPKAYVPWGGCPKTWGDASPLHCNLAGLPPVYVITGEFDYILPQAYQLMDRARADGATDWQLDIHPHMIHVFMNLPTFILPYAQKGLEAMAAYAAAKWVTSTKQHNPTEEPRTKAGVYTPQLPIKKPKEPQEDECDDLAQLRPASPVCWCS